MSKNLFQNKNFLLIFVAQFFSLIGDFAFIPVAEIWIFKLTNSGIAVGCFFIFYFLPKLMFSNLCGVFADKKNKKMLLVISDMFRALCLLGLFFVENSEEIYIVYFVIFVLSSFSQQYQTANAAIVPALFKNEQIIKINSNYNGLQSFAMIVGPVIGVYLFNVLGFYYVVALNSFTFLISACMLSKIRLSGDNICFNESLNINVFQLFSKDRLLRKMIVILSFSALALGVQNVGLIFLVKNYFKSNEQLIGTLMSVQGIGAIAGSIISSRLFKKSDVKNRLLLLSSSFAIGFFVIAIYLVFPYVYILMLGTFVEGVIFCWIFSLSHSLIQENYPKNRVGQIFGFIASIESVFTIFSMGLGGILISTAGVLPVYVSISLFLLITSILCLSNLKIQNSKQCVWNFGRNYQN